MDYIHMLSAILQGSMTPREILWDIYLPNGREMQAAWFLHEAEDSNGVVVWHGIEVKRVNRAPVRDLVG